MRAGGLRHVATVQRKVRMGKTAAGEDKVVWQDWRQDVLFELSVMRGKEQFDPTTKRRYSEEVYRFRTRYDELVGISTTMRLVDEHGTVYDIKALLPDRNREADILIEATLQNSTVGAAALILELLDDVPVGHVGSVYPGFGVAAAAGSTPYTFSIASGALPTGLSLSSTTGTVSGTPTAPGTFNATLRVTDAAGDTSTLPAIAITISP